MNMQKSSAGWQSFKSFDNLPESMINTDSVVYYDSTFSRRKQENDKSARFLVFGEAGGRHPYGRGKENPLFPCL